MAGVEPTPGTGLDPSVGQWSGTGRGKLILFGEHAAVYGHPAIGVQLPECTTLRFGQPAGEVWGLDGIPPEDRDPARRVLSRLEMLLPDFSRRGRAAVSIRSNVPRGAGLGSSAALCVATAQAALRVVGEDATGRDSERVWELAHELERLFHGTPSGIDTGLSLHEGLTAYSPRPPALPGWERVSTVPFWIVAGAVPRAGKSAALIRGIGERMSSGDRGVDEALAELGRIALQVKEELAGPGRGGSAASMGRHADAAMEMLRDLGLSDHALDDLLEEGKRAGALGGKLSGAGAGGAFFCVVENEESARRTAVRLLDFAFAHGIGFVLGPRAMCVGC